MFLKLLALIYRKTGWFCPLIYIYQYRMLMNTLDRIEERYNYYDNDMSIDDIAGIEIGMWQVRNGFTRRWKR